MTFKTTSHYEPDESITQKWESGEYGRDEASAEPVSAAAAAALEDSLGLQLVSIRLQKSLIKNLKMIAKYRGVSYQPLIRDLLNRFAASELRDIFHELEQQNRTLDEQDSIVAAFMAREQARKRA